MVDDDGVCNVHSYGSKLDECILHYWRVWKGSWWAL